LIYRNCTGQKLKDETVDVWYNFLKAMSYPSFKKGIEVFLRKELNPAEVNFVAALERYASEGDEEWRNEIRERRREEKMMKEKKEREEAIKTWGTTEEEREKAIAEAKTAIQRNIAKIGGVK